MPYVFPGSVNQFPFLDKDLRIFYARNPARFPLARYALMASAPRQLTHYTVIDHAVNFRFPGSNTEIAVWPDGTPRPDGRQNRISAKFEPIEMQRYLHNAPHGAMSIANQSYDVISTQMLSLGQRAGTLRALKAYARMQALITANTITNSTLNAAISETDITAGTVTNPIFYEALNYAAQVIHNQSGGVVNESDLRVVIGPTIARKLALSAEMLDYVARSPDAMDVMNRGFSNNRFGLPLRYKNYELVVEDTVVDTAQYWATAAPAAVFSANQIWILARQDGKGGNGVNGAEVAEGTYPTIHTALAVFEGPYYTVTEGGTVEYRGGTFGMGSDIFVNTRDEILEPSIRDNFGLVSPAPLSAYVYTSAMP